MPQNVPEHAQKRLAVNSWFIPPTMFIASFCIFFAFTCTHQYYDFISNFLDFPDLFNKHIVAYHIYETNIWRILPR